MEKKFWPPKAAAKFFLDTPPVYTPPLSQNPCPPMIEILVLLSWIHASKNFWLKKVISTIVMKSVNRLCFFSEKSKSTILWIVPLPWIHTHLKNILRNQTLSLISRKADFTDFLLKMVTAVTEKFLHFNSLGNRFDYSDHGPYGLKQFWQMTQEDKSFFSWIFLTWLSGQCPRGGESVTCQRTYFLPTNSSIGWLFRFWWKLLLTMTFFSFKSAQIDVVENFSLTVSIFFTFVECFCIYFCCHR